MHKRKHIKKLESRLILTPTAKQAIAEAIELIFKSKSK